MLGLVLLTGFATVSTAAEQELTGVELQAMVDTFQDALENNPTSQPSDWVNPDDNRSGAVVPTRTFEDAQGRPCREFVSKIIIGDQEEQGYGTACRQVDGNWQLVADAQPETVPTPVQIRNYFVEPPLAYYAFPPGFYGPSPIYLSFGYVFRSGNLHRGHHYLDGRSFHNRYPTRVRQHTYLGAQFFLRHRLNDELNYRNWDRRSREHYDRRDKRSNRSGSEWRKRTEKERRDRKWDHDRQHN